MGYGTVAGVLRRRQGELAPAGLQRGWESGRLGDRGTLLVAGLLAALFLGAVALLTGGGPQLRVPTLVATPQAGAPSAASMAASRGLGLDQRAYWVTGSRNRLLASNAGQRMRATFTAAGVRVVVPGGAVTLSLRALGRGDSLDVAAPIARVAPVARANRVSYTRKGLVEWYANGPFGLEQGVTLSSRPAGAESSGALKLAFALGGSSARLNNGALTFAGAGGRTILRYSGLIATDSRGRVLPSQLRLDDDRLLIEVNDQGARYPVTIDPLIQAGTLTTSDPAQGSEFGFHTAVSGSTLVVGAASSFGGIGSELTGEVADAGAGALYVFTEPASGWAGATQVATLTASAANQSSYLGGSVAISGSTIYAMGIDTDSGSKGEIYVYAEPQGGWRSETETAVLSPPAPADTFKQVAVSASASGDTVFAGAPGAGTFNSTAGAFPGAVYVFKEPAGGWTPSASSAAASAVLTPSDAGGNMGANLAVSGQTLVAGAPAAGHYTGAVYVFQAPWTTGTQTAVLTAPDSDSQASYDQPELGATVATEGTTIVAAAPEEAFGTTLGVGAVYVYTLPKSGVWTTTATPAAMLTAAGEAPDGTFYHLFGTRVAVGQFFTDATDSSAPKGQIAETVFVGTGDGTGIYVFTEPASGWKSTAAPPVLGLASASPFSLTLSGGYLIEGADNSTGEYADTPDYLPGSINVFDTPSGGTLGPSAAPVESSAPVVSGSAKAGGKLTCSTGTWSNNPTSFTYQWYLNGTPIQGATSSTYKVQSGDEQLTLSCSVTASNSNGAGKPAAGKHGITIPVPHVTGCPKATGGLSGVTLGLVKLGDTRTQATKAYTHSSNRGKKYEDFFCLTPIGIRVGFASPALLHTLPKSQQTQLAGRVIWASTSSAYYTIDGIRVGATITAAGHKLKLTGPIKIGLNDWYLANNGASTAVLKVRHKIVQEIGIGDKSLTNTTTAQHNFLKSFS